MNKATDINDLDLLVKSKGEICLTIILPLATLNPQREQNKLTIDKAIQRIEAQAHHLFPDKNIHTYINKIKELVKQIDDVHPPEGIGIWVSDKIALLKKIPFAPQETTQIGTRFLIKELLTLQEINRPTLALLLTEKEATIFKEENQCLTEIKLPSIKALYNEKYEYATPSRSSSYAGNAHVKSYERDEELLSQEKRKKIFSKLDHSLQHYVSAKTPLFVVAENRLMNEYRKITSYPPSLIHYTEKDPSHLSKHEILQICKDGKGALQKKEHQSTLELLRESVGTGHARVGLQACWRAVEEGNCRVLLVEKNYYQPGFLRQDPFYLFLTPPITPHQTLSDAVDELIELILKKKGSVLLVEPGILAQENKIGLITRY